MKFITRLFFAGCIFTAVTSCNNDNKKETVDTEKIQTGTSRNDWGSI